MEGRSGCAGTRDPQCHPQGSPRAGTEGTLLPPVLAATPECKTAQVLCRANPAQRPYAANLEKSHNLQKYLFAATVEGVYCLNPEFPNIICWELTGPCSFAGKQNNLEGALQALREQTTLIYIIVTYIFLFLLHLSPCPASSSGSCCVRRVCESVMIKEGGFFVLALGSCAVLSLTWLQMGPALVPNLGSGAGCAQRIPWIRRRSRFFFPAEMLALQSSRVFMGPSQSKMEKMDCSCRAAAQTCTDLSSTSASP